MAKWIILVATAAGLAGCGQSSKDASANDSSANAAVTQAPKPAYCFFQDSETKAWKAKVDKSGNVVISGKAYREDPRYKALLEPAKVTGTKATVAPTISQNDTGFAAPGNWWDVSETIPDSGTVTTVDVNCGGKTIASLAVPRAK